MKNKILKTKVIMYLLLVVLTVVYARMSYVFYDDDLSSHTSPQIKRAMVQISRLLPQLEENEKVVQEVYDSLETSRHKVYKNNEDILKDKRKGGESAETIIDSTLSWMDRIIKLRVGRQGHVIVISKDDKTILAHPDERFVGEPLYPVDKVDLESVPDISKIEQENIGVEYHIFFPLSFFKKQIRPSRFGAAVDAGIYGTLFSYKDTYILCGTTLNEAIVYVIVRTFFTTLIFFLITWVFLRYIGFWLVWQQKEVREFRSKLFAYGILCVIILFSLTWYYQRIMDMTGDIATMNNHAQSAVDTLNTYREYRKELSGWLDEQYLEQCHLAADLVKGKGKENISRKDLAKYAKELGVRHIYVFDKKGRTYVTNSPYDHFVISKNEGDQSYGFRPLLDGREYVIQSPQKDEMSGKRMQYIGVSLRDENDLCDGFVQIAVDPSLRDRLLAPINVQTVLDNMVIGLPEYALAIDKKTMKIAATTGLGFEKENVKELGLEVKDIKKNFNGIFLINGVNYYAGVSESDDLFLMPLARSTDSQNAFSIALKLTVFGTATLILMIVTALFAYKRILVLKETDGGEEPVKGAGDAGKKDDDWEILEQFKDLMGAGFKYGFSQRWKEFKDIPIEQQTPGMRTQKLIYRIFLVFSVVLILFVVKVANMGVQRSNLDGFSYVLMGDWQKGINLFSISFCLFLFCVLYVLRAFFNQILYRIAKVTDVKNETILLLIKNALKYASALIFLYIGLAKFGVDTRALWASAGVLSLMIGFGAKDMVSDIIAGLFIIFEGVYKLGDFVMIGEWVGSVQAIGLRYTRFARFSETKVLNNSAVKDMINFDGEMAREVLKIPISYETDLLEVEKLLERELPEMAKHVPGLVRMPEYRGVNSFEESCMMLRICIYCVPWKCRKAYREMLRQIKLLFDREHISIPYNHMVVKDYNDTENTYTFTPVIEEAEHDLQDDELS